MKSIQFKDLLRQYIDGKALQEVANGCTEQGVKVDFTYLSKLQTGDRPAPKNDQLLRAVATVCGKDPKPLIQAARLERDPTTALRQIAGILRPVLQGADDPSDEDELVIRLAKVAQVSVEALSLSLQALKATR